MKRHFVYVIKSITTNKFYIGQTRLTPTERLQQHNDAKFPDKFTFRGGPWELFWYQECTSETQALRIENHIKNMKSRVYIENLRIYPEIIESLLERYKV